VPQTRMRSRKIAIARHCRRDRAYVYPAIRDGWRASALAPVIERAGLEMAPMHSTRTAVFAMLVALLLPAPAVLAETAPSDRSKTAGPISAELAKTCRALAIKAHPTERAGSRAGTYAQAQRDYSGFGLRLVFGVCLAFGLRRGFGLRYGFRLNRSHPAKRLPSRSPTRR